MRTSIVRLLFALSVFFVYSVALLDAREKFSNLVTTVGSISSVGDTVGAVVNTVTGGSAAVVTNPIVATIATVPAVITNTTSVDSIVHTVQNQVTQGVVEATSDALVGSVVGNVIGGVVGGTVGGIVGQQVGGTVNSVAVTVADAITDGPVDQLTDAVISTAANAVIALPDVTSINNVSGVVGNGAGISSLVGGNDSLGMVPVVSQVTNVTGLAEGIVNGAITAGEVGSMVTDIVEDVANIQGLTEDLKIKISDLYNWVLSQVTQQHPYLSAAGLAVLTGTALYVVSQILRSEALRSDLMISEASREGDVQIKPEIKCDCAQSTCICKSPCVCMEGGKCTCADNPNGCACSDELNQKNGIEEQKNDQSMRDKSACPFLMALMNLLDEYRKSCLVDTAMQK